MFEIKFTTEAEAIEHIAGDKAESCATALRTRFEEAIDSGITDLNLAAEKAVVLHAHLDHEAGLETPEEFPFSLDADAESHIAGEIMTANEDGRAEERVDLTIDLFRRYREWGVNIFFAGQAAVNQAQVRWEKDNPPPDLDEGELFEKFDTVGDPHIIKLLHEVYAEARKDGKSVRESGVAAVQAAKFAAQLASLLGGSGPDLGGFTL